MSPEHTERFRTLHVPGEPLVMPNAWDLGSARIFADLGAAAIATTSGGLALSLGRTDGEVSRDDVLAQAAAMVAAVDVPVSADLEDGYGADPEDAAATVALAVEAGLAGASIEDHDPRADRVYDIGRARAKVEAAADVAHRGAGLVLTARAENFFRGHPDLDDAITRLQAYQEAGADVLYAPGLSDAADIARVVAAVDRPVNVVVTPTGPTVGELARLGVARISVGGTTARQAYGVAGNAVRALLETGIYPFDVPR